MTPSPEPAPAAGQQHQHGWPRQGVAGNNGWLAATVTACGFGGRLPFALGSLSSWKVLLSGPLCTPVLATTLGAAPSVGIFHNRAI